MITIFIINIKITTVFSCFHIFIWCLGFRGTFANKVTLSRDDLTTRNMIHALAVVLVRRNHAETGAIRYQLESSLDDFASLRLSLSCADSRHVSWHLSFLNGYSTKCLLTELSLAGRKNFWLSWRKDLGAFGSYFMTSRQILCRPALQFSQ